MGDDKSNKIEELHEQIMHDTIEAIPNATDFVRLKVEDDHDSFKL